MTLAGVNLASLSEVQFLVHQVRTGTMFWRACKSCGARYLSAPLTEREIAKEAAGFKRPTCLSCKEEQRDAQEDFAMEALKLNRRAA